MRLRALIRLLVMAVSVSVTIGCQGMKEPPTVRAATLPDSADQMLIGVTVYLTDGGVRRAELKSDTALMYEDNTRTEMRKVNTIFYTISGTQNATLTSKEGTYNMRLGTMEARGSVFVNSTEGRKLTTPQLRYDPGRNEVSTDSAFRLTMPDGRVLQGIGFISDPDLTSVRILKNVRASGQRLTIPKQ